MAQLTITVRDADMDTLAEIAEREWRTPEKQASALLEQVLHAQRARAASGDKPKIDGRRGRRPNGVAALV